MQFVTDSIEGDRRKDSSDRKMRKQLLDDLKEEKRYSKMEQEAADCTLWRNHFGTGYGPVTRQMTQ